MKKHQYCICKVDSKHYFNSGWLIFGGIFWTVLPIYLIIIFIVSNEIVFFCLLMLAVTWALYWKNEYKRQSLHLGHSDECSKRYSTLAFIGAADKYGHSTTYSGLKNYRPFVKELLADKYGIRGANRIIRKTKKILWIAVGAMILSLMVQG